jgi:hypothetical protein
MIPYHLRWTRVLFGMDRSESCLRHLCLYAGVLCPHRPCRTWTHFNTWHRICLCQRLWSGCGSAVRRSGSFLWSQCGHLFTGKISLARMGQCGFAKKYAIFEALGSAFEEKGFRIMTLLRLSPTIILFRCQRFVSVHDILVMPPPLALMDADLGCS